MRIIMHVDVNNAFLSWNALYLLKNGFNKDIRNCYAVIGADEKSRHGIVLAKSMPAKKMGVVTAEPIYMAKKKCPNLEVYPPNYFWYKEMSNKMFDLIRSYTPDIEIMSIDECFIDYTKVKHLYGDEIKFAYKLQKEIYDKLGFTVNVGVANCKLCAKMASDFSKPYKVHTLFENELETKMKPLPVDELFFVGKKTAEKLHNLNIHTIKDLSVSDPAHLYKYFKNQAIKLVESANGIDNSEVETERGASKGISNSTTLSYNLIYKEQAYEILEEISDNITRQLRKEKRYANTVSVNVKDRFFKSSSHQIKLKNPVNKTSEVFEIAKRLFDELWDETPLRLIGISLTDLTDVGLYQVSLFEDTKDLDKANDLENVVDEIKNKYGVKSINKASLASKKINKKY